MDFEYSAISSPELEIKATKSKTVGEVNGFYISHFLKLMYNTVDVLKQRNDVFGNDSGEKIFREFLLNEYGQTISEKFKLTNNIFEQYFDCEETKSLLDVSS